MNAAEHGKGRYRKQNRFITLLKSYPARVFLSRGNGILDAEKVGK
jgi:hypothetical protein